MRNLAPALMPAAAALACLCGTLGFPQAAAAQKLDAAITIGHGARLWSEVLQEERRLLVYTPPHYEQSGERYPVLYLLDAEAQFRQATAVLQFLSSDNGRMPEMIVIGITNTRRTHDLTPAATTDEQRKEDPDAGGDGAFLRFLVDELQPWVDSHYRTQPYRVLVGHSLGGLFAVNALLSRPDAFNAYLAISPSLWFDERAPVARAEAGLGKLPAGTRFLRLSWADGEPWIRDSTQALVDWLKANPTPGVQWSSHYYAGDNHGTTPLHALYDGMEELFAGWELRYEADGADLPLDLAMIEAHAAKLSRTYGFPVKLNAYAIDTLAGRLLEKKDFEAAIDLLQKAVGDFPLNADLRQSLGDALAKAGRPDEAARAYREALDISLNDENTYVDPLQRYRESLRAITSR